MIAKELLNPKSIVICGASSDVHKPGGKSLKNLLESPFKGQVYALAGHCGGAGLCGGRGHSAGLRP